MKKNNKLYTISTRLGTFEEMKDICQDFFECGTLNDDTKIIEVEEDAKVWQVKQELPLKETKASNIVVI
jgi:hypothetical protein